MIADLNTQIAELLPSLGGWCSVNRGQQLARHIVEARAPVSVSIGIWCGRDTLSMALAHRAIGGGHVLAIDPYQASASIEGEIDANRQHWNNQPMHDRTCAEFLANVRRLGLEPFVRFERQRSDDVPPPSQIWVLSIDGNHTEQAVRDVERYASKVVSGGIVYADDIQWTGGHVQRAVARLMAMGFEHVADMDTGAFFKRA